ncbi:AAA family ATPase [Stratiformator vulcanicus]|uniref:Archaeal ATPase n=1 Tax=Stratiformator vulcanicus TaxID=2527980 RepID=A0A517R5W2_9PLAN|nr:AAA family ATPase [Stratiformator vulcanicus]QDT39225.1 Archaeal ATPase [Stratiformator vulcanicus]
MKKFNATDVFTPSTPAKVAFVEREQPRNQLVDAIITPGMQIVVYGHSGSGKTTLIHNKLEQTREFWIKTSCTSASTIDSLILDAFDKLGPYYKAESTEKRTRSASANIKSSYLDCEAQLSSFRSYSESETQKRVLPPQITMPRLIDFLGESGALWIVEDFHKLPPQEKKKFAQILKQFMDASAEYREIKVIAIGAKKTAREVIEYDPEMENRVAEIYVPLMDRKELFQVIGIGEDKLNCEFSAKHTDLIARLSNGLGAVCHQLCLNMCFEANLSVTEKDTVYFKDEHFDAALARFLSDKSDTFKKQYEKATRRKQSGKFDNCKLIVHAIAEMGEDGGTYAEILKHIHTSHPKYPAGNLTNYLKQLQTPERAEIIKQDSASGRFSFFNQFMKTYVYMLARNEDSTSMKPQTKLIEGKVSFQVKFNAEGKLVLVRNRKPDRD